MKEIYDCYLKAKSTIDVINSAAILCNDIFADNGEGYEIPENFATAKEFDEWTETAEDEELRTLMRFIGIIIFSYENDLHDLLMGEISRQQDGALSIG